MRHVTLLFLEVGEIFEECGVLCHMIELNRLHPQMSGMAVSNNALGVEWQIWVRYLTSIISGIHKFSQGARGGSVEVLRHKPKGRGFDSRWRHWNFSLT